MTLFGSLSSYLTVKPKPSLKTRFEIIRPLATERYWKLFVARDRQSHGVVRLKIFDSASAASSDPHPHGVEPPREGAIGMRVNHPYILETLDYGVSGDGKPYVAMEYPEGPSLGGLLMMQRREIQGRRLLLIRHAAEALVHVHRRGFIHRDVCPRNFTVARDFRSLKLMNFGLSVPDDPRGHKPTTGIGSLDYMPPEVYRHKVDRRLDVFSFGILAYEICTFQLPWPRGPSAWRNNTAPVDIRNHRPRITPRLAEAIAGCIRLSVQDRTPSLQHFLNEIADVEHEDL